MLYVYALLSREPQEAAGNGILGEPLRVLNCGGLFAAVSEIGAAPPLLEQNLRRHEETVRRLAERADAILPARFGSVMPDEPALTRFLESREPGLRQALTLVTGKEQMTIRVYGESAPAPETPRRDAAALGPGAAYLAGKMGASEQRDLTAWIGAVRPELAAWVRAERIRPHDTPPLLGSIYHLIERGQSTGYIAALNGVASEKAQFRFSASGPWPPYAFAGWEW